jgi:hypothetical protein
MEFKSYNLQIDELETLIDTVKFVVIGSLVNEKVMEEEEADKWCQEHTVIIRKKSFFRTITDKWLKEKGETEGDILIVIKKVF